MYRYPSGNTAYRESRDADRKNLIEAEVRRIALHLSNALLEVDLPNRAIRVLEIL